MFLAGDIGGTNCRLAWFERDSSRLRLIAMSSYRSSNYSSVDQIIALFLAEHAITDSVESAAFGVAGPVQEGRVQTTNLPWLIEQSALCHNLNTSKVALLNDLVANAYGTQWLTSDDYVALNTGVSHPKSSKALISAGTGLGEAGLVFVDGRFEVVASEGGHCSFAPVQALEIELFRFLQQKYGHVSYERVVSGAGLINIHEFLGQREAHSKTGVALSQIPELAGLEPAAKISQAAMLGLDPTAEQALDLFVRFYGAEAGNLALKFLATGAVYVGGGITPKILPKLQEGGFFSSFIAKGRLSTLLEQISIFVILNDQTALLGAALVAARLAGYNYEKPPIMETN